MRVVFDTNVYVSAFVVPRSRPDLAYRLALRGAFELVVSPQILAETREKLASKFGFSDAELEGVEKNIRTVAVVMQPEVRLAILDDEPDNRVLECALHSGAVAIVTGDHHLLGLKSFEGIGIMTVAQYSTLSRTLRSRFDPTRPHL